MAAPRHLGRRPAQPSRPQSYHAQPGHSALRPVEAALHDLFLKGTLIGQADSYTGGHAWRVAQLARHIARAAGWSVAAQARIALGGFLHDLGKIAVPAAVLNKPGSLTPEEFRVIKDHPSTAKRLLDDHPLAPLVLEAVVSHHERLDGSGYPAGLKGREIGLDARIVSLADSFDAMTSNRPYRAGMPVDTALSILRHDGGQQYDPEFNALLAALAAQGDLDPVLAQLDPGIPVLLCPHCRPVVEISRDIPIDGPVICRQCGAEAHIERLNDHIADPGALAPDHSLLAALSHDAQVLIDGQPERIAWSG